MKKLKLLALSIILSSIGYSQLSDKNYLVYNSNAESKSVDDIINNMADKDVLFFGEEHNDSVAHYMELELLKKMYEKYKDKLVLSMEMFERESQTVLNEYIEGKIKESHFKKDAKVWSNYRDYRPLIEFAKANHIKVVASNAAMRYVSMANKHTQSALLDLSPEAKKWMAPLPFDTAQGGYYAKLRDIMGYNSHDKGASSMMPKSLNGQSLWDATMAYSISEVLNENKGYKVLHLVGRFHIDEKYGICQQITHYKKDVKFISVSELTSKKYPNIKLGDDAKLADFIIYSDPKVPKTFGEE